MKLKWIGINIDATKEEIEEKLKIVKFSESDSDKGIERVDDTPLSLELELDNGKMYNIILRGTTIPCEKIFADITEKDYKKEFILKIFQGERLIAKRKKK